MKEDNDFKRYIAKTYPDIGNFMNKQREFRLLVSDLSQITDVNLATYGQVRQALKGTLKEGQRTVLILISQNVRTKLAAHLSLVFNFCADDRDTVIYKVTDTGEIQRKPRANLI